MAEVYLEIRKSLEDQVRVSVCSPLVLICTVICLPFSKPLKRFGVKTNVCCIMLCNSGLNSQQNVQVLHVEFGWYSALSCCLITFVINQPVSVSDQNPVIRNRNIGVPSKVTLANQIYFHKSDFLWRIAIFCTLARRRKLAFLRDHA